MLLGQHRGRHQDRDLRTVGHRLEGGPKRHLRLAVPHVARDEPVHRAIGFHVALGVLDRSELIRRLLEPERRLELTLPGRVRCERVAVGHGSLRVESEQPLGHLAQRGADGLLYALPRRATEAVEPRGASVSAEVLRDEVEALDREVEPVALRVLEQEEVALAVADPHRLQAEVAPEPVVLVDDDVADREIGERREGSPALVFRPAQRPPSRAEDLPLGEHDDAEGEDRKSGRTLAHDDRQRLRPLERHRDHGLDPVLPQDLAQMLRLAVVGGGQPDAKALGAPASELPGELIEAPGEARHLVSLQRDLGRRGHPGRRAGGAGDQTQLDELTAGEPVAEWRIRRSLFGGPIEQFRHVDHDRRRRRQIVEESRAGLVPAVLGGERQDEQFVERHD